MTTPAPIDLRSDTVTRPSDGMRRAMAEAEVGDDVLDGDPTTKRLEARVAELLGHEAALYFPSGIQANQTGVGTHLHPGEELVLDANAHLLHYEAGGVAGLWGAQIRPIPTPDGVLNPELVADAMRVGSPFIPRTGAIAVENTHNAAGGTVTPLATMQAIKSLADDRELPVHLDGARIWNAACALQVSPADLARCATTVMVSLSKGLGCPVGSCLAGSRELMDRAWVLRRRLGGAMRQSGVLAAAGLYALDHTLPRIGEDHEAAQTLYQRLVDHPGMTVHRPQTNIVMIDLVRHRAEEALALLADAGVLMVPFGPTRLRAVTHLDVSSSEVARAADIVAKVLG